MQLPTSCSPVWKRVVCAARCPRSTARCGNRTCACGVMSADTCPPVQAPAAAKARGSTRVDSGGLEKKISKVRTGWQAAHTTPQCHLPAAP
eukprot:351762-Chlamydomonas_euryale.AAC.5